MIRKLAITGGVLVALVVGADLVAQQAAETALAGAASNALGVDAKVDVEIDGFPILFDVLRGRLDGVSATVTDQRVEDLRLRRVGVRLDELRAEGSIFGGGPLAIVARRTELVAETDEASVNAFLKRRGEDARVRLLDGEIEVTATRSVLGVPRRFTATGPLAIDGSSLLFRPREVTWDGPTFPGADSIAREATTVREELPALPGGIRISGVVVTEGTLAFTGSGEGRRFVVRR